MLALIIHTCHNPFFYSTGIIAVSNSRKKLKKRFNEITKNSIGESIKLLSRYNIHDNIHDYFTIEEIEYLE